MAELTGVNAGSNYQLLIQKLDRFIRKYYTNQILRGLLITVAATVAIFLIYTLVEHQFYLSQGGRKIMFFSYVLGVLGTIGYFVAWPMLKYFRLGDSLSHEQAASILGEHFKDDVQDKLLNILQLKKENSTAQNELITASIDQKVEGIKLVPFKQAIDFSQNKKYLRYALPPVMLLLGILFINASLIKDSTYRIINNDVDFEKPAPFHFQLEENNLEVIQYEDFRLTVDVDGETLPNEVFIKVDNYDYRMSKEDASTFTYLFDNVRKDTKFEVYAGPVSSKEKTLSILPKPKMVDFQVRLNYPRYVGRKSEIYKNNGDLAVPEGTTASWTFDTRSTDEVKMTFGDTEPIALENAGAASFQHKKYINKDVSYEVSLHNDRVPRGDVLAFNIRSIKDEYPQIAAQGVQDSAEQFIHYFVGSANDDYGLTNLQFVYERVGETGNLIESSTKPIAMEIGNQAAFEYILDINEYDLGPGEKLNYYFQVFDNDQVNGSKSAKTSVMSHRKKSIEELKEEEQENEEEIKDKLESSIQEAKDIQKDLKKLREKLLQKQEPDWQDKKELERLLERQQELQKNLQNAQDAHQENMKNQEEMQSLSPEMQEKQERLQELFEETVNEEMQNLMEQIQNLMEELGKEESLEMMEQFEMNEEQLENEMERLAELYKSLEVEKEMEESIDKLNELAEELEQLSEETEEESKSKEELEEKQEEINEEFEDLKEKMEELQEKNDELEYPQNIPDDAPEQMEEISDDLQDSQEQLGQEQNDGASESQKDAGQKMKNMAGAMQQQMQAGGEQQMGEDIETIRQLLENLVTLSFGQEDLVNHVNRTVINTPRYVALVQNQMKIGDDFKVVEDTLQALSKRNPDLETFVLEKVGDIKSNLTSSLKRLEDRKKPEANQSQRTTMKNLNDLALMLSESMEQMQQQMAGMMSGSQMCQNPGNNPGQKPGNKGGKGGQPGDKISEGQEKMSDKLKEMVDQMKSGKGNSSKDFAQAAAKQAALRKALQDMAKEQQESGQGTSGELQKIIDEMNKQEIDLVNKRLDNSMLSRQQDIVTRLLEAESAQKEREYDNKRKSEAGEKIKRELPPSLEEYINERKALLEQYKYVSPELRPHYKKLVDQYYKKLKRA